MKFLCVKCDVAMEFEQKDDPQDGTLSLQFKCPSCEQSVAMLTNPGETQFVRSLGVQIGHEQIASSPMSMLRSELAEPRAGVFVESSAEAPTEPLWTEAALRRLSAAPTFVQAMVRKLYTDYARSNGYAEVTPAVMNEARDALGMTGM
jgi:hypothetical protein